MQGQILVKQTKNGIEFQRRVEEGKCRILKTQNRVLYSEAWFWVCDWKWRSIGRRRGEARNCPLLLRSTISFISQSVFEVRFFFFFFKTNQPFSVSHFFDSWVGIFLCFCVVSHSLISGQEYFLCLCSCVLMIDGNDDGFWINSSSFMPFVIMGNFLGLHGSTQMVGYPSSLPFGFGFDYVNILSCSSRFLPVSSDHVWQPILHLKVIVVLLT